MERSKRNLQTVYNKNKYEIVRPKRKLPINLHKKALREKRQRNECRKNIQTKKPKKDFKDSEIEALVRSTEMELKRILSKCEVLSDIPYDCTTEELLGEIALAEGRGMIVYIQRNGLSTLTIVLPQENPTIANLKRAIESASCIQLKRQLLQRHEERLQRRTREQTNIASSESGASDKQHDETKSQAQKSTAGISLKSHICSTGELVCSTQRNNHQHRANVSWRFLWRAYMLYHMETNQTIDDSNGRRLLSKYGIENATTLKFCKRENYYGRKRQ